jgi:NAD(P)H-dependent FMN reductase
MNILILSCSHRTNSNSKKVAHFLKDKFPSSTQTQVWDLCDSPLPFWNEKLFGTASSENKTNYETIKVISQKADGLVLITPEWGGMATPACKNYLLLMSQKELFHKPVWIVSVSSGTGGAYPVTELKAAAFKNNFGCPIPDHLIIRHVESFLKNSDEKFLKRIQDSMEIFLCYCESLKKMRNQNAIFSKEDLHPFGL